MPKQFQQIPLHGFQETDLHRLHPVLIFLEILHPVAKISYREVHKDDGNMLRKFLVNPFYCLGDMNKTILGQEIILNYYKKIL